MPDMGAFLTAMKQQAVNAMESTNPVNLLFGTVTQEKPLQITTDQMMVLGAAQLILTRNVTEHVLQVVTAWQTSKESGGSGDSAFAAHAHNVTGGEVTVKNALKAGERVILVRQQEGQRFLVLDRVVSV